MRWLTAIGPALLLSACQDFSLAPAPAAAPFIDGFEPLQGYYGDLVVVHGGGFDPVAEANTVVFPGEIEARGVGFEGGSLLVYVPDCNGNWDAKLVVRNRLGSSVPSDRAFFYSGPGYPWKGTFVNSASFLHRPANLAVVKGEPFLVSDLLRAVVAPGGAATDLPEVPLSFAANAEGDAVLVGFGTAGEASLELIDPASGATLARSNAVGVAIRHLAPVPVSAGSRVIGVGESAQGSLASVLFERSGDVLVANVAPLPMLEVRGAAALADGRLLVSGKRLVQGELVEGVMSAMPGALDLEWVPATGTPTGLSGSFRLGPELAVAVPLDDGAVDLVAVSDSPRRIRTLRSMQGARVGSLAAMPRNGPGPLLVASIPALNLVKAVDPETDAVVWSASLAGEAGAVALDPANDRAYVAFRDQNSIDVLEASSGRWLDRRSLQLGLGNAPSFDVGTVAPYSYSPEGKVGYDEVIATLARRYRRILTIRAWTLVPGPSIPLAAPSSPPLGLAVDPSYQLWVVHERELGLVVDGGERIVASLDSPPLKVAFSGERILVGSASSIAVFSRGKEGDSLVRTGGFKIPDGSLLTHLEVREDGTAFALWSNPDQAAPAVVGGVWEIPALERGDPPPVRVVPPDELGLRDFLGAIPLRKAGTVLLFARGGEAEAPWGLRLQPDLELVDEGSSPVASPSTLFPTPGGHHFGWVPRVGADTVVRISSAWDGGDLWTYSEYQLSSRVVTPVLDPSGEWLYIPLPMEDRIVVLQ